MCQTHWFICVKVGFGIKKRKMLLLASLYVFITQCNKLYFQYSCQCVIECISDIPSRGYTISIYLSELFLRVENTSLLVRTKYRKLQGLFSPWDVIHVTNLLHKSCL